ncbi:hypothetical protein IHQ72_33490 [Mesorhizobium onobrychidis]|uniref:Uncharacterized protein n=1 Tax=Mesorhizobium onobrychidis TaxID=2775404 RepID=A0ABY5QY27_9HYPH|nr:hypothetical protein IHQ72_33490 [Mesorhizobium onobrychidis]
MTLLILWEEYRSVHPDGYGYSRYVAAKFMLRLRGMSQGLGDFLGPSRHIRRTAMVVLQGFQECH